MEKEDSKSNPEVHVRRSNSKKNSFYSINPLAEDDPHDVDQTYPDILLQPRAEVIRE